jgi:predicted MPP superfamily phosphohydrolase
VIWLADAACLLLCTMAVRHVYGGGRTLNDHLVAVFVVGCTAVYPMLWHGAEASSALSTPLLGALLLGPLSIYGLFHILARREDAGWRMPLAVLSQPAYAFSLWTWLLLVFWVPWAWRTEADLLWPGALLMAPLLLSAWGTMWTYLRRDQIAQLHLGARGLRIVHLSDIHASPVMRASDLRRIVSEVNGLRPDLVAVTGDLLMPFSEGDHGFLIDALERIQAQVFCCMGNHDLPVAAELKAGLEERGIRMLVDESAVADVRGRRVEVIGLDFHWRGAREKSLEALSALPEAEAALRLLLVHDPRYFAWLPKERFDLALCGHTHGGQAGANMFGWRKSVLGVFGLYDQGLFEEGGAKMYVHRGNWHTGLPPRMGIAGEIAVLEL